MTQIWSLEFNIFVMMAVGFLTRQIGIVSKTGEKNLTDLVLLVILPCSIFISFLNENALDSTGDMLAVVLISVGIQALSLLYGKFAF
ncbi:MAG: AEC family transporter, partial [Clostridia bacterium]|nr:AEC family transporter [Clostridia bacterium]